LGLRLVRYQGTEKDCIMNFPICTPVQIQSDQKVSVHLMITIQKSGAERVFDHPVLLRCI